MSKLSKEYQAMCEEKTGETCACSDFKAAQESGTDNEGYGRLARNIHGFWAIGSGLMDITFCPWCGKRLP